MTKQILVVVDIQKAYSPFFSEEYLSKVKKYIEGNKWDEIIVRFVGEDEYSVFFEDKELHTFYEDSRFIPDFLNKENYKFSERWFGYEMEEEDETIEIVKDKLYKVKQDGEWWYMSNSPNGDMYCPCRTMESLLNEEAEFHLVGGFKDLCLKEVYDFLTLSGVKNVNIEHEFCFENKEPEIEKSLIFTSEWSAPKVEVS